jgi:hypothetical protein
MEATDTVGELLNLQEIDSEILRIKAELGVLAEEIAILTTAAEESETRAAALNKDKEAAEERVRRFQRSVQAGRATLKRLEARSAEVTNMQQHFAVRTETDTARRNLRVAEDEALDAMQDVETISGKLAATEASLAEARSRLETRTTEIDAARSVLEARLAEHGANRRSQEQRLDRKSLQLYQSVSGGRRMSALASLTVDGVCGGCYTAVPIQRQSDIRARRRLAVCEGCGVILYADDSTP